MAYTLVESYSHARPKVGYARNRSRKACINEGFLKHAILGSKRLTEERVDTRRVRETIVAAGTEEQFQPTDFDPDFEDVNVFMDDIGVLHDGAKPGSLTDHRKISGLVKYCTNEDVRQAVRDLRTDGYTDEIRDHKVRADVTWPMARDYMVQLFGGTTTEERAVDLLLDPDGDSL